MPGFDTIAEKFGLDDAEKMNRILASEEHYRTEVARLRQENDQIVNEAKAMHDDLMGRLREAHLTIDRYVTQGRALSNAHADLLRRHRDVLSGFAKMTNSVKTGQTMVCRMRQQLAQAQNNAKAERAEFGVKVQQLQNQLNAATAASSAADTGGSKVNTELITKMFELRAQNHQLREQITSLEKKVTAMSAVKVEPNAAAVTERAHTAAVLDRVTEPTGLVHEPESPERAEPCRDAFLSPEGSVAGSQISMQMIQSIRDEMELRLAQAEQTRADELYDAECRWRDKMKKLKEEVKETSRVKRHASDSEDCAVADTEPVPPTIAFTTVRTTASRGSSQIDVMSTDGFSIGAKVRIGTTNWEERIIVSFGSLILDRPTEHEHLAGEPIVLVERTPTGTASRERRTASRRSGYDGDESDEDTIKKGRFEYKVPKLDGLPQDYWKCKSWLHGIVEKVEAASARTDDSERTYLLRTLEIEKASDPWLHQVPRDMVGMNRVLVPELQKLCKKDPPLARDVESERQTCINSGRKFTAVKIIHLIISNLKTDKSMTTSMTAADLVGVHWRGDDKATEFLQQWLEVDSRIEAQAMSSDSRMNLFYQQVRQSEKAALALHKWTDKDPGDRTYEELLDLYRKWLHDRKTQENFMRIYKPRGAVTTAPTVSPVVDTLTAQPKKPKPRPKKPKNKEESDVAPVQTPKGPKDKPKAKCLHFQTRFGAKGCERKPCSYRHWAMSIVPPKRNTWS